MKSSAALVRIGLRVSLLVAPIASLAQYPSKPVRIIIANAPDEFAAMVAANREGFAELVKFLGLKPE